MIYSIISLFINPLFTNLAELIQKVAISAASIYFGKGGSNLNRVIIGKDTRLSGYIFEPALGPGLIGKLPSGAIPNQVTYSSFITYSMNAAASSVLASTVTPKL